MASDPYAERAKVIRDRLWHTPLMVKNVFDVQTQIELILRVMDEQKLQEFEYYAGHQ